MKPNLSGTPNFTVTLPGKCNAKCAFCFWKYEKSPSNWLQALKNAIRVLPREFTRVSVTGGEPTLSPCFNEALKILREERDWDAVVLTTNGIGLDIPEISNTIRSHVDHLNISRHSADEEEVFEIFQTKSVPNNSDLGITINIFDQIGIDTNINCTLIDQFKNKKEVLDFINFVRIDLMASSVCFRKDQRHESTVPPKEMSWLNEYPTSASDPDCPVCAVWFQDVNGFPVRWKASIPEPSKKINQMYELIFQQNGKLTLDWAGEIEFDPTKHFVSFDYKENSDMAKTIVINGVTYIEDNGKIYALKAVDKTVARVVQESLKKKKVAVAPKKKKPVASSGSFRCHYGPRCG